MLKLTAFLPQLAAKPHFRPFLCCQMPKRNAAKAAKNTAASVGGKEDDNQTESEEDRKPTQKKRKPTQKQIEEAELAAKPSLASTLKKEPLAISALAEKENAQLICLQETKLQSSATEGFEENLGLAGWHHFWACSETKKGYSGTAVFSKNKPISTRIGMGKAAEHDEEGRIITLEFEAFFVVNVYTPNAGEGLKRLDYKVQKWDPAFAEFVSELQAKKPVVVTGDLNCAHNLMDIHSPWTNKKSPGFSEEERESFGKNLASLGLTDCFRHQYPDTVGYTYWNLRTGARAKNKGWRLDYFLVSEALKSKLYDCFILKSYKEQQGLSDHCPIGLTLKL